MPELPEVETHILDLQPRLQDRTLADVEVSWPKTVVTPDLDRFCDLLPGQTFRRFARRAKYMLLYLDDPWCLVVHLRMTGTFRLAAQRAEPHPHVRVNMRLQGGEALHFLDQRKFGRMWLVQDPRPVLAGLGPEPLSRQFTGQYLQRQLGHRAAALKAVLLDQKVAAGVGNIYADEALFHARLHPQKPARTATAQDCQRLCRAVRKVLRTGIALRGSFIGTYRPPSGVPGRFQLAHQVFRRTGEPCTRCGTPIAKVIVAQRSTHFCPRCQADRC